MPISNVGRHVGEIIATGLSETSTGNAQVFVQFKDEEENTITAYLSTETEAKPGRQSAWYYTEKKLTACGFVPADHGFDLSKLNDEPSPILGMRDIPFTVDADEYNGKVTHKVGYIGDGGGAERMPADKAKLFSAQLRAKLIAASGPSAAPAPRKTAAVAAAPWA